MADLRKYWAEVAKLECGLADYVWLTPRAGGASLAEVAAPVAAKLLHAKSHRLATDEEVAAHRADQDAARRRAFNEDLRRKGIAVIPVGAAPKARP